RAKITAGSAESAAREVAAGVRTAARRIEAAGRVPAVSESSRAEAARAPNAAGARDTTRAERLTDAGASAGLFASARPLDAVEGDLRPLHVPLGDAVARVHAVLLDRRNVVARHFERTFAQ